MAIEARTQEELDEIKSKIKRARRWARKHFNADGRHETRIFDENLRAFPPSFFVEFPGPDTMRVAPSVLGLGRPTELWFEYRLQFRDNGTLAWCGRHPVYGFPLPPLIVRD